MDPFLITMTVILAIGGIILTATIIILNKKGISIRWYGFFVIILMSIAMGIHFGVNFDFIGGLIVTVLFIIVGGFHWFWILKMREKIHKKKD